MKATKSALRTITIAHAHTQVKPITNSATTYSQHLTCQNVRERRLNVGTVQCRRFNERQTVALCTNALLLQCELMKATMPAYCDASSVGTARR